MRIQLFTLIIGEPGIGKSTALKNALSSVTPRGSLEKPVAHTLYKSKSGFGAILGTPYRENQAFPGTDGLAFNVQPKIPGFLESAQISACIAEGDRLANAKFVDALKTHGWKVQVVHLFAWGKDVASRHRETRAAFNRAPMQDERWVAGRRTKSWNLAESISDCIWVDVEQRNPVEVLNTCDAFREILNVE